MNRTLITLLAAAAPVAAGWAAGEEVDEEIVVRAAPLNRTAEELTQPAIVLSGEELLLKSTQNIGETLAGELGVSSSYFGPVAGRPVIRGQAGPRVTVLEDGVGALDVSDVSADHAVAIEPLLADGIEVIRGPATLLYGSSAAAGVVNVIDNRIPESLTVEPLSAAFELRGDSAADERAAVGRLDGSTGMLAWHLDGFYRETNDIEIPDFATADPAGRPPEERRGVLLNSFGESQGYAGGVSLVGDDGFLGVSLSRYENDYGLPGPEEEEEEPPGGEPEPLIAAGPFIQLEQTRVDLRGGWSFDGPIERARLRFGRNDYEHAEIEPTGEVATQFDNDAWEGRVELVHAPLGDWRGAFGVQAIDRDFSAIGAEAFIPPTQTKSYGIFLVEEREFGAGRFELGGRVETAEHEPDPVLGGGLPVYDETAWSAAAGVVWDFAPSYDMRLNLSRSERHPAAEELYSDGPHLASGLFEIGLFAAGAGGIEQEVANNADLSIHQHRGDMSWGVTVFYNDIADYIFLFETGAIMDGLPVAEYRQQDAEFYGYEAEIELPLSRSGGSGWDLRLFTDYVRGKTDTGDLPRIQPRRVGAELGYGAESWAAGLDAIYHAEQDDISSFQTDSFTLVNADFVYALRERGPIAWQFFVKGTNLLDEEARRSTSFRAAFVPLPGISFHAGVRAGFR